MSLATCVAETDGVLAKEAATDAVAGEEAENESVVATVPVPSDALGAPEADADAVGDPLALGQTLPLFDTASERLGASDFDDEPDKLATADAETEGECEPDGGAVREANEKDCEGDPEKLLEMVALNNGLPVAELAGHAEGVAEVRAERLAQSDAVEIGLIDALCQPLPDTHPEEDRDVLGLLH